jgi:putative radical SAM enzyme (TIGR03279 family)
MAVRIKAVGGRSGFFRAGDEIIAVDGAPVEDQLDILFRIEKEGSVPFTLRRPDGRTASRTLRPVTVRRARLEYEEMRFIPCRSRCIFCFVDQMPPGLRETLYEKDDDYRLSFLFGNYVTLNDVKDAEIRRIIEMNLSPLYLSVHALDPGIRRRIFGRSMKRDIRETIDRLARAEITMHVQIVLMPGINDGPILERTIRDLALRYPAVRSVAVVPVGLTRHRDNLEPLRRYTVREAKRLVRWGEKKRMHFYEELGEQFIHLADEFYLLADRILPDLEAYDDLPQLANGVGMCRLFLDRLGREVGRIRRSRKTVEEAEGKTLHVVTGELGGRFFRRYVIPYLDTQLPRLTLDLITVQSRLFGREVGVTGLLAGRDIIRSVKLKGGRAGCIVLPPNAFNHDGLLIDGMTTSDLENELNRPVVIPRTTFLEQRILRRCGEGEGR